MPILLPRTTDTGWITGFLWFESWGNKNHLVWSCTSPCGWRENTQTQRAELIPKCDIFHSVSHHTWQLCVCLNSRSNLFTLIKVRAARHVDHWLMGMWSRQVWHSCRRVCVIYIQWIGSTHRGYWFIWMYLSACVVIRLFRGLSLLWLWWKLHHWQPGRKATSMHQMQVCKGQRARSVDMFQKYTFTHSVGSYVLDLRGHLPKPCYA